MWRHRAWICARGPPLRAGSELDVHGLGKPLLGSGLARMGVQARGKAKAEAGVLLVERGNLAMLCNRTFSSLDWNVQGAQRADSPTQERDARLLKVITDHTLGDAIFDWLVHSAYRINPKEESTRKGHAKLAPTTLSQ